MFGKRIRSKFDVRDIPKENDYNQSINQSMIILISIFDYINIRLNFKVMSEKCEQLK